jgi:hypothetical protein
MSVHYDDDAWEVHDPDDALVLIACSQTKATRAAAPARELYTGSLFQDAVRWAESWEFRWMVLSARHGLVDPDRPMTAYDAQLPSSPDPQRTLWLRPQMPDGVTSVIVLGGQRYVDDAHAAWPDLPFWAPLQELSRRGYGHYRAWLRRNTR